MINLAEELKRHGHEVQFFGMYDKQNTVGNDWHISTSNLDFHTESKAERLKYAFSTIRSEEAYKKMRMLANIYKPDIALLENVNYQLTPSVIEALHEFEVPMIMTVHDFQLVCPNHMMYLPEEKKVCDRCLHGSYWNCAIHKCVHGSLFKSIGGSLESIYWHRKSAYKHVDLYICPSRFMQSLIEPLPFVGDKAVYMQNFSNFTKAEKVSEKEDYLLYFGRISEEKGIMELLETVKALPEVQFHIAGDGPLSQIVKDAAEWYPNLEYFGYISGDMLKSEIAHAKYGLYPSKWYENCPMSIIEAMSLGTPMITSASGGIPELIQPGTGFIYGEPSEMAECIRKAMALPDEEYKAMAEKCLTISFPSLEDYYNDLIVKIEEVIKNHVDE